MERIDFCDKYCPIPARWIEFPKVDNELSVDCDLEESICPFKDVDFSKIEKNNVSEQAILSKLTICELPLTCRNQKIIANLLYDLIAPAIAQQAREEIFSILEKPLMYFKTEKLNSTYTQCPTNTTSHFCDQELVDALRQALKESK